MRGTVFRLVRFSFGVVAKRSWLSWHARDARVSHSFFPTEKGNFCDVGLPMAGGHVASPLRNMEPASGNGGGRGGNSQSF